MKPGTQRLWMGCLLALVALSLQGCFSDTTPSFQTTHTRIGDLGFNRTEQAHFQGRLYFTLDRNLYTLDGSGSFKQLTHGMDVRDPAVSPDGKWVAFIVRYQDYSDLVYMPTGGGGITVLFSGKGNYYPNPPYPAPKSTHHWFAQPSWSADSKTLLFLSDLEKEDWYKATGQDAPLLDLQVFSVPFVQHPTLDMVKDVAYADYGAGGDRDPGFRPHYPDQVVYTHYTYQQHNNSALVVQIYLEDATMIAQHPGVYHPGTAGSGYDPAVALTAEKDVNLQPSFSPDGRQLTYIRRVDATHTGLYIMSVTDGITQNPNDPDVISKALQPYQQSVLLLQQTYISQPVWSPDGKSIAYIGYTDNTFELWLAHIGPDSKTHRLALQGQAIQLTSTGGHLNADSQLCWIL